LHRPGGKNAVAFAAVHNQVRSVIPDGHRHFQIRRNDGLHQPVPRGQFNQLGVHPWRDHRWERHLK